MYFEESLKTIVDRCLAEFGLKSQTWFKACFDFLYLAIEQIKPSSKDLNDSIDFSQFVKIYLLDWQD